MDSDFTPSTDELLRHNARYAATAHDGRLQARPTRRLTVVACMDARIDTAAVLGLGTGEAHTLRNAGGVVTDDVIRSVCLSQRALGTREVVLIHHTDCGLEKVEEATFYGELEQELGVRPGWSLEAFTDPYYSVRLSIRRIQMSPFIPHKDHIRGFVYDVADGVLREVKPDETPP